MTAIAWNRYGKAQIRLVKIEKSLERHDVVDLDLDIQLEGEFQAVYEGDNRQCLATDTMKNTAFAYARRAPIGHIESFAVRLADHFIAKPAVSRVRIQALEKPWTHLQARGRVHPYAFIQSGGEQWSTVITRESNGTTISSGITDLLVMKTTDSAFAGFPRDEYTTLPDTDDRVLATSVTGSWTYRSGFADFSMRERIRAALLDAFALHRSHSVQHTLAAMGAEALQACEGVTEITLRLPNRHHLLADLTPFGLDNPNEVFVATSEPYGLIEATIRRE